MKTQEAMTKTQKTSKKSAPKSKANAKGKSAKPAKPAAKAAAKTATPKAARAGTKSAIVLGLLRREQGATIAQMMKATDWQSHSIRGFLAGQVTKKMGLKLESTKTDGGERTYRITA